MQYLWLGPTPTAGAVIWTVLTMAREGLEAAESLVHVKQAGREVVKEQSECSEPLLVGRE